MSEWQSYKIKDVGTVVTGNTPPTSKREFYGTEYKFIKPTDMQEGQRFVPETEEYYSELAFQKYQKSLLPKNTPCVVTIGSLGKKMCLTDEPSFTNQAVNAVIPNKEFDGVFLYYCLRTRLAYVKQLDSGTTSGRENVSKSSFSNITLKAPSLPTQKKIASVLSVYDNLIENNNKRIKILEQMAENLYKEWFVRFRFPGHETIPIENGIPKGWIIEKLGNVANISTGKCNREDAEEDGVFPLFDRSQEIKKSSEWIKDCEAIIVPGEGTSFMPRYYWGKFNLHQRCYCVEPKDNTIGKFLFFVLKLNRKYFLSVATGATVPSLRYNNFAKMQFVMPPRKLCQKFNEIAKNNFAMVDSLKGQNDNLIKQRDLLLPRLMSGKLAV